MAKTEIQFNKDAVAPNEVKIEGKINKKDL